MKHQEPYIVQYVGFQTGLDEDTFLQSWKPFATSFKSAGIRQIDIYTVENKDILTYIARNVWPTEAYLKNFPSGVPGAARTQDVNVLQFGGYELRQEETEKPEHMTLIFQREEKPLKEKGVITRLRITEKVPFKQILVLRNASTDEPSTNEQLVFSCSHLKSL
ncbi:hypothetical protein [Catalinimonas niigatensis]|uniref:hypothetical protein n=1 Tax=Catalinimonas niigatensis TaxID=1397264 RepID=UPI0026655688|nr:hypothetical protein [Catalinimonas niigatensis]WPP49993.1 hypothetical protein PZB72_25345 [Catalinimonas niigatensis]